LESNYTSIAIQAAMGSAEGIRRQLDSVALPGLADSTKARIKAAANERVVKVVKILRRADQLVPTEWRTSYFGAQLFAQLGRADAADSVLAVARKRLPNEPMLLRAQAEVYQRTGRLDKAAALLDSAAVKSPKDAQLHLDASMLLSEIGRNEEALKHVEQALKLAPSDQRAQAIAQQIQMRIQSQPKGLPAPQVVAPAPNQAPVAAPAKPVDPAKPAKKTDSAKK
jgi:tetratricopeptide (TPR) repeat protein